MRDVLIGLSSCYEAFLATPVVQALQAAGRDVRIAWFGPTSDYERALALGLPDAETLVSGTADDNPERVHAAEFAADPWCRAETVLTLGSGPFALALALQSRDQDVDGLQGREPFTFLNVRLDGGVRGEGRATARLLADHAATHYCVADKQAASTLLAEGGVPAANVIVCGSLTRAALPVELPATQPVLWLAIEHERTLRHFDPEALLHRCAELAQRRGLRLRVGPKLLGDALREAGLDETAWIDPADEAPRDQLDAALRATLIVTDSHGYQDVAAAAGIRCIALGLNLRWDHMRGDRLDLAPAASELDEAADRAFARTPSAADYVDFGKNVSAALVEWGRHPGGRTFDPAMLPTDGDISGRTFDERELTLVEDAIRSGTLNSTRGTYVHRFEQEFAAWQGSKHAIACANGSAAVHCAIAALGLSAGDEVITTPITDMGALTPIFYEGAVPVFADVDPDTLNVTAATIEAQLTERTKAIIVTHLFGRPCDMQPIVELACRHDLPIVEDTAQAFGATIDGRKAGRHGLISAFSLQQGKHITTGEGGIVCTDDDELARKVFLFVNKAWGYGDEQPDHYFPALNYRMTELQGAVACGQLPKLDDVIARRRDAARTIRERLSQLHGIACPDDPPNGTHSYWKFAFRVDADVVPGGAVALGKRMRDAGIACAPRYVQKPAFECQLFRDWREHPVSSLPLQHNPRGSAEGPLFERADYPGAIAGLEQVVVLPINERYHEGHAMLVADAIGNAWRELTRG